MRSTTTTRAISAAAILSLLAGVAVAQPTAFTYQGELRNTGGGSGGGAVQGPCDLRFELLDAGDRVVQTLCADDVGVTNGRFTVVLDSGSEFATLMREVVAVRVSMRPNDARACDDDRDFVTLLPAQPFTAAPLAARSVLADRALMADSLLGYTPGFFTNAANLTGTVPEASLPASVARLGASNVWSGAVNRFGGLEMAGSLASTGESLQLRNSLGRVVFVQQNGGDPIVTLGSATNTASLQSSGATISGGLGNRIGAVYGFIGGGSNNIIGGQAGAPAASIYSVVLGGESNNVQGARSAIGGGTVNSVQADSGVVGGGERNLVQGRYGTIGGGGPSNAADVLNTNNRVTDAWGVIGGGGGNRAGDGLGTTEDRPFATVGGGRSNTAAGEYSTVGGGSGNQAQNQYSTVGGGINNTATGGGFTTVAGGSNNAATGFVSSVAGGDFNTASGSRAAIGGGNGNAASGGLAVVGGGGANQATAGYATVGGGSTNQVSAGYGTVGGGASNVVSGGGFATIAGGSANASSGFVSTVGGGDFNTASGERSTIGGGSGNVATNRMTTVAGGFQNRAEGEYAAALGGRGNRAMASYAAVAGGNSNSATFTDSAVLGGSANRSTNINAAVVGGNNNNAAGEYSFVGGGQLNGATGNFSTISGGGIGQATGQYATVIGGSNGWANADYAVSAGGFANRATAPYAFAAGKYSFARHAGSFVWGDSLREFNTPTESTGPDQFIIMSAGGVCINTTGPTTRPPEQGGLMELTVGGDFSAFLKFFRIDHPLDPANKELLHACVESDEYKNIYDGTVTTDAAGFATVTMPEWFSALNEDFRYQLTVIDDSANDFILAKVFHKIGVAGPNSFVIKTSMPGVEISWQVTGNRKDAYAKSRPMAVEIDKPESRKGTYLYPAGFTKTEPGAGAKPAAAGAAR